MRSSARTPPHRQVRPSPRRPVASPAWWTQEDWSPRRYYKTMQYLYRPNRQDPDSLVKIPFHLNRPLLPAEFWACAEQYCMARSNEYLTQLSSRPHGRPLQNRKPGCWPDLHGLGLSPKAFWKYEIPLRRFDFAESRQQQGPARCQVKKLATSGPIRVRQMLKNFVQKTPQAKRQFSSRELLKLVEYRAERQFVWAFLRKESDVQKDEMRKPLRGEATKTLAAAYRYLRLKPQEIVDGLRYPSQADKDTAEEFGVSESSVRSLLSKSVRR